jgi:ADP-ribosylglycohydrolase
LGLRAENCEKAVSSVTHARERPVVSCLVYTEYLLKLPGGMGRRNACRSLCEDFQNHYAPSHAMYTSGAAPTEFGRIPRTGIGILPESAIKSGGFVIDTLEAALWCFLTMGTYRDAVLKAVNLGSGTGTAAAVTGGIAGLFYGKDAIPANWLRKLSGVDDICRIAVAMADALTV